MPSERNDFIREQTFRRYLDGGRLERGFARVRCASCAFEMLVPWACKLRALCASCVDAAWPTPRRT
jgi:LSD1 subclass zinc finger protein